MCGHLKILYDLKDFMLYFLKPLHIFFEQNTQINGELVNKLSIIEVTEILDICNVKSFCSFLTTNNLVHGFCTILSICFSKCSCKARVMSSRVLYDFNFRVISLICSICEPGFPNFLLPLFCIY